MRILLACLLLLAACGGPADDTSPCPAGDAPGDLTCVTVIGSPAADGISRVLSTGDGAAVATLYAGAPFTAPAGWTVPDAPDLDVVQLDGDLRPSAPFGLGADVSASPIGIVDGDVIIGGSTTSNGLQTGFYLARWSLDGTPRWEHRLPFLDRGSVDRSAFLMRDNEIVLVASIWQGRIDLGDGPRDFGTYSDLVIVRHDLDGDVIEVGQYGDAQQQQLDGAVLAPDGDLVIAGQFGGTLDLGDLELVGPDSPDGVEEQLFFVRIAPDGSVRWARQFGDDSLESVGGLGVTSDDVVVAMVRELAITPDPTVLGDSLVRFDDTGEPTVVTAISSRLDGWMAPLDDGGLALFGHFDDPLTIGDQTLTSAGDLDGYIVRLDADLGVAWASRFGGPGIDRIKAITPRGDGAMFVTGLFTGEVTIGDTAMVPQGELDTFAAVLTP